MSKSAENGFGAASRSVLGDGHASGLPQSHLIISLGGLEVCDAGHRLCDEKTAAKIAIRVSPQRLASREAGRHVYHIAASQDIHGRQMVQSVRRRLLSGSVGNPFMISISPRTGQQSRDLGTLVRGRP